MTRGKAAYPHPFDHDDSKGNKLAFPDQCPEGNANRKEYPLATSGVYNGGKNNNNPSQERVVYFYDPNVNTADGHPKVLYCGIMTHTGAPSGGFIVSDVGSRP